MVSSKGRKTLPLQLQWRLNTVLVLFVLFCLASSSAFAAYHAVTPSGAGAKTGADWNNSYAGLPATLTRGDVYCLADGSYGKYTFTTAASGTTTIEVRKAQASVSDGCTALAGWNGSTMGSSQAVFSNGNGTLNINAPFFILNGNGTSTSAGCGGGPGATVTSNPPTPSDCGIKIDNSGCTSGCYAPIGAGQPNLTISYVEIVGDSTVSADDDMEVFSPGGTGPTTWTHIYGHNAGCVYFQDGLANWTVSKSYFWGTEVKGVLSDGCHGQFSFDDGADSNSSVSTSVFRDITGTAIWTFANASTTHNNWAFYDNVIWFSSPAASWSPFLSDGILACINSGTNCTNFVLYQNTIINPSASTATGINNENTGSYIVHNNLWYDVPGGVAFNVGTGGTYTQSYNSFLNATASCRSGTSNVCDNSASNPFTNWTAGVFTLASDASDWNNRTLLSSPYNTDAAGNTFTTYRGAYQYDAQVPPPSPPTGLAAVVK